MTDHKEVFYPQVPLAKAESVKQSDLYDLLKTSPAVPLQVQTAKLDIKVKSSTSADKIFVPKRKKCSKVKTIREIRKKFEDYVYSYIGEDLKRQQQFFYKKIRHGSAREDKTIAVAKKVLNCDRPISKTCWQMLRNLNPEKHPYSQQYVFWNSKNIRINGSKGGDQKFVCNYNVSVNPKISNEKLKSNIKQIQMKKKMLLHSSLNTQFKPGPLKKKIALDNSYQKYHLGETKLSRLPEIALKVNPAYGVSIEPFVYGFLQQSREENGVLTEKWADFAVASLGTLVNNTPVQDHVKSHVFPLNYRNKQNHIIVRDTTHVHITSDESGDNVSPDQDLLPEEVAALVLDKIISAVEISLKQDAMCSSEEPIIDVAIYKTNHSSHSCKDKSRKKFGELQRLDVTVIQIDENANSDHIALCSKAFCTMGCVCSSLECRDHMRNHCGQYDCILECKCDYSKYRLSDGISDTFNDYIPGLVNLRRIMNLNLAKEEQEFHQTVVVTEDKSIMLKAKRRNWRVPKKFDDFHFDITLKGSKKKVVKELVVAVTPINILNVEPLCMVHGLYKCFCKGRFLESLSGDINDNSRSCNEETIESITPILENVNLEKRSASISATESKPISLCKKRRLSMQVAKETAKNTAHEIDKQYTKTIVEPVKSTVYEINDYNTKADSAIIKHIKNKDNVDAMLSKSPVLFDQKGSFSNLKKHIDVSNTDENKISEVNTSYKSHSIPNIGKSCSRAVGYQKRKFNSKYYSEKNKKIRIMEKDDKRIKSRLLKILEEMEKKHLPPTGLRDSVQKIQAYSSKRLINGAKFANWLERSCSLIKKQIESGTTVNNLGPPAVGKVLLLSWTTLMARYTENKNYFLVSCNPPYCLHIAVDPVLDVFKHYMNINEIKAIDLKKYPNAVKKLLMNSEEDKDNFYILRGRLYSWELIGSASKTRKQSTEAIDLTESSGNTIDITDNDSPDSSLTSKGVETSGNETANVLEHKETTLKEINSTISNDLATYNSKWFVMTIENDFSEIQFYKKGFFVKYDSILQAIGVARSTGKTVRLSAHICAEGNDNTQFGIYAAPITEKTCVFIGPYAKDEPLGIETLKRPFDKPTTHTQKYSRGVWLVTKQVENSEIIENPLSFLPQIDARETFVIPVVVDKDETKCHPVDYGNETAFGDGNTGSGNKPLLKSSKNNLKDCVNELTISAPDELQKSVKSPTVKVVKPIKIRRTNGFYQLDPTGLLKPVSLLRRKPVSPNLKQTTLLSPPVIHSNVDSTTITLKPDTVGATEKTFPRLNMSILKPEEINKKALSCDAFLRVNSAYTDVTVEVERLETPPEQEQNKNVFDILVISDDEDNLNDQQHRSMTNVWSEVWIECKNVEKFGCLRGRINAENKVGFKFPDFKFTDFYEKDEAFLKINQVLSRKVFWPKGFTLQWRIVHNKSDLRSKILKTEDLCTDYIVKMTGVAHESQNGIPYSEKFQTRLKVLKETLATPFDGTQSAMDTVKKALLISAELKAEHEAWGEERRVLQKEFCYKKAALLDLLKEVPGSDSQELNDSSSENDIGS